MPKEEERKKRKKKERKIFPVTWLLSSYPDLIVPKAAERRFHGGHEGIPS
jgi:hypothetical protein